MAKLYFQALLLVAGCFIAPGALGDTLLRQSDFANGSYIIDAPGTYVLVEDVTFHPNGHLAFDAAQPEAYLFPTAAQRADGAKYSGDAFTLGFFAAVVIQSDNVVLDLNGHRLEQSELHALMQRFFAIVEIANAPFPPGKGPAAFSDKESFKKATGVVIRNGTMGRSSHHSIHGNDCEQVSLLNLTLRDFEVAGIALNRAKFVVVDNVDVVNSRQDIPVSGRFSQAIFALRAATVQLKLDNTLEAYAEVQSAVESLRASVARVVSSVTAGAEVEDRLFRSLTRGLPDGSLLAGIMFHPLFHVGAFLKDEEHEHGASQISLSSVRISNLSAAPVEVAALVLQEEGGDSVHDNVGAIFDVDTIRDPISEAYVPNPLANLQLALAQYAIECDTLATGIPKCLEDEATKALLMRNTIDQSIIDWCLGKFTFSGLLARTRYEIVADHDYMFHFNKGVVGVKLDGVVTANLAGVDVSHLENHATRGQRSVFFQRKGRYFGFGTRAYAISSSVNVTGKVGAEECFSEHGADVIAVDLRHNSTKAVLEIDAIRVPTEKYSRLGRLPIKDPIFRRSGCPFGSPASTEGNQDSSAGFEVAFYTLLATQLCSLVALSVCAFQLFKPTTGKRGVEEEAPQKQSSGDDATQEGITRT